jgi:hypothetical protein
MIRPRYFYVLGTFALTLMACSADRGDAQQAGNAEQPGAPNTLTPAEKADGWKLLFDGTNTDQWRGYKSETLPSAWMAMDGTLMKDRPAGDIMTKERFGNFELALDWQISKGGNAGIFYRGTEEYDHVYWSAPEYQILDDANAPDGHDRLTSAGAAYALYPPPAGVVKPAGEWNTTRIVVNGAHVEHWLNGQKLLSYELWSPDWTAKVKASKFKDYPSYGKAKSGYIAIQGDHDGVLSLRNIKIKVLP